MTKVVYADLFTLLDETKAGLSRKVGDLDCFEKIRLIEGLESHAITKPPEPEMLMTFEVLISRLDLDPWLVEISRNLWVSSRITEAIRSKGYTTLPLDAKRIGSPNLAHGLVFPAMAWMCKNGLMRQSTEKEDEFVPTTLLWSERLEAIRHKIAVLFKDLAALAADEHVNDKHHAREYERLRESTVVLAEELQEFGLAELSKKVIRRKQAQDIHMSQHHAGPWVVHLAGEFRASLYQTLCSSPPELELLKGIVR